MNTFDIIGLDPLELNGKPATIQTIIDALWSDDYHEQQPMTGAPEVCLCELCQSLVPALEQIARGNGALLVSNAWREKLAQVEAERDALREQLEGTIGVPTTAEGGK